MIRSSIFLFLALVCGGISTAEAASGLGFGSSSTTPAQPPPPRPRGRTTTFKDPTLNATGQPDDVLKGYLTYAQRVEFDEAIKKAKDANSLIMSANIILSRPPAPKTGFDTNADDARTRAQADIIKAQAELTDIAPALQNLRKIAMTNMEKTKMQAKETASAVYTVTAGQWPNIIQSVAEKTYAALEEQGYKRVYLLGVYSLADSKYSSIAAATDQVRELLVKADKDKNVFLPKQSWAFRIGMEGNRPVINYSERNANQQGNIKAAVVLGEMIYEPVSGYAAFSLRAVDLGNLKIVSNASAMLSVEPTLGKMLGLGTLNVPSKPVAAADKPETAVSVSLQDPGNLIGKVKDSSSIVGVTGANNTAENRFAVFALKSYFTNQADLGVADTDMLMLVLAPDQASSLELTSWVVPEIKSMDDKIDTTLGVRTGGSVRNVGKMTIERTLPKLTPPTAADLRAAGYIIGGGSK